MNPTTTQKKSRTMEAVWYIKRQAAKIKVYEDWDDYNRKKVLEQ